MLPFVGVPNEINHSPENLQQYSTISGWSIGIFAVTSPSHVIFRLVGNITDVYIYYKNNFRNFIDSAVSHFYDKWFLPTNFLDLRHFRFSRTFLYHNRQLRVRCISVKKFGLNEHHLCV